MVSIANSTRCSAPSGYLPERAIDASAWVPMPLHSAPTDWVFRFLMPLLGSNAQSPRTRNAPPVPDLYQIGAQFGGNKLIVFVTCNI